MNRNSQIITTLIHYNVVVRDTLEYCLRKDSYETKAYDEKKRAILVEVEQNTPLKAIINNSGENGQKLEKTIRDFHENVYGDGSTIIKVADDGLRVDHAQHFAIYDGVINIHSNVEAMILGLEREAISKKIDVTEAMNVNKAENRLYCGVAFLTLTTDLANLFRDYNQARAEAKGEESPSSRFIGNDIGHIIQLINTVKANSHITDAKYKDVEDKVTSLMEMMTGRRDLPEGKNFPDVIKDTEVSIQEFVRDAEPKFRDLYQPLIRELIQQAAAEHNVISGENKQSEPKKEERKGQGIELDPITGLPKA